MKEGVKPVRAGEARIVNSGAPILVTGLHRGGTTWVGRMIAAHRDLEYIHEPFNPESETGRIYGLRPRHWWLHVHRDNEESYRAPVRRMVEMKPLLWSRMREARSWGRRREIWRECRRMRRRRRNGGRMLIKDPIALFSAEWLVDRFTARVVVVVRHPAAWTDSFLRTDWPQPRGGIEDQPALRDGLLRPFRDVLSGSAEPRDRLARTCTTWNMFLHVIREYRRRHDEWLFVRHEDLSRNPLDGFQRLYGALGLKFDADARDVVRRNSLAGDERASYARESIVRDSRRNLLRWRRNLPQASIDRIRDLTADYWPEFYEPEEWMIGEPGTVA